MAMKQRNKVIALFFFFLFIFVVFNLYNKMSVICQDVTVFDQSVATYTYKCNYNGGCYYQATCPSGSYPKPASSGNMIFNEEQRFYCIFPDGSEATSLFINLKLWGKNCQGGTMLTPVLPSKGYFTTDESVIILIRVDGGAEGEIINGKLGQYETQCSNSVGQCTLSFGKPKWGDYTLEVWSNDNNKVTKSLPIKPLLKIDLFATAYEQFNNQPAVICAKIMDENGLALASQDINSISSSADIDGKTISTTQPAYQSAPCSGIGNYKVTASSSDTGMLTFTVNATKTSYLDGVGTIQINIKTPNIVTTFTSAPFGCLNEQYTAKFEAKSPQGDYLNGTVENVVVKDPDGKVIQDITASVRPVSTGIWEFDYTFKAVEGYTFVAKITSGNLGSATAYMTVGVSDCGSSSNWMFYGIIILIISIPILLIIMRRREK